MKPLAWTAVFCLLSSLASPANATTAIRLGIPELIEEADLILVATAVDNHSLWMEGNLYTTATLEPHEILKGTAAATVVALLPGGIDAQRKIPVATVWPGQPRIEVGERVLLFLNELSSSGGLDATGLYSIVGFSQGKFTVDEVDGSPPTASRDLRQLRLTGPGGVSPGHAESFSLEDLRDQIRRSMAAYDGGAR